MSIAARIARRELRGGLQGFRVFLACLALGVAAIAAVGLVRAAIEAGLTEQGAVLLGGDAQMELTYRKATPDERAWMEARASRVSEVVEFRSMAVVGEERALTQVKAVDDLYPLLGELMIDPPFPLADVLEGGSGLPGAVMDRVLADRLGLAVGESFRLGTQSFRLGAVLDREPDSATGGFSLAPRTLVLTADLARSGLLGPGTLYETEYRLDLPEGIDLAAAQAEAEAAFRDKGMRWSDSRRASPGVERFVDRTGSFLVLVGLAGLAVGGVGISAAVRAYLEGKIATIATLRTLGAEGRTIFLAYLIQIGVLTALGVMVGLGIGILLPLAASPFIVASLPFPITFGLYPGPLAEAAFYGIVTALLFTLWPLARTEGVRAAALYRGAGGEARPRWQWLLALAGLAALLVGGAVAFSGTALLALGTAGGISGALAVLLLAALALRRVARRAARSGLARGRTALRLALGAIGGPREEAVSVVLSLGLGLSVLAAVGQIDANLRAAIDRDLPERAPSYFFVDIQQDQIDGFLRRVQEDAAVSRVEAAPMLRGVLTRINGRPAREVAGEHWVVRGDRGISYAATPPESGRVVAGSFWPADYQGPAQVSFAAEEAEEIGLKLGDRLTVNILGRDIEAEITSFREVDFSSAGMGFVMVMNPSALQGAPHTFIATVYAEPEAEAAILRDLASAFPNITAIRVRDAIDRVTEALSAIATATAWAAAATLVTGFIVLIGAAAAGERGRIYEAAVLKTLGATRGRILASFALRSALLGAAAGLVAILAGGLAGWAVMTFVMDSDFRFEPVSALAIVAGGILATLLAGMVFALRPLRARPAQVLRAQE
ncbi:FtsX-like permease family protein [Cereibacter sphaeroides]|uniref:ABC transporter permease n=1 Tax=Cereibacter sphaeroides TaxID=1063 RepID=UPI001F352FE7|nr:FtsX-like permease family protein [Cereibacter sphaeroides]MCE6959144.1 FtsX-like permease family protein [Cereibacter sphaeroides]MCE6968385.1 FtsX-like permease family protein [Cereibacter sphaeroides]MCE6974195.1 FtsX-like permease family protein [Cereibacter sphaeroides]